jgi:transcriptional regulator with XRE-family HTH domain
MMPVAEAVKTLRVRLGKTQAEFASILGVQRNTVNRWEMGKFAPGIFVLFNLHRLATGGIEEEVFAEETKRQIFANAGIQVDPELAIEGNIEEWRPWISKLEAASSIIERLPRLRRPRKDEADPNELRFATAAGRILTGLKRLDRSMVAILNLWAKHGTDRRAAKHFRDAAAFLRVQLANLVEVENREQTRPPGKPRRAGRTEPPTESGGVADSPEPDDRPARDPQ